MSCNIVFNGFVDLDSWISIIFCIIHSNPASLQQPFLWCAQFFYFYVHHLCYGLVLVFLLLLFVYFYFPSLIISNICTYLIDINK